MRNLLISLWMVFVFCSACAQSRLGFRVAPGLAYTGVSTTSNNYLGISSGGAAVRGSIGPTLDVGFAGGRLALGTGLWYTLKAAGVSFGAVRQISEPTLTVFNSSPYAHNLHYLQVPLTLKLYTGQSADPLRFYLQAGVTIDWKVAERAVDGDQNYLYQLSQRLNGGEAVYKSFDAGLYTGAGIERATGGKRKLFAGIAYNRGLLGQLNDLLYNRQDPPLTRLMDVNLSLIALELGTTF